jgi:hypothetical protein
MYSRSSTLNARRQLSSQHMVITGWQLHRSEQRPWLLLFIHAHLPCVQFAHIVLPNFPILCLHYSSHPNDRFHAFSLDTPASAPCEAPHSLQPGPLFAPRSFAPGPMHPFRPLQPRPPQSKRRPHQCLPTPLPFPIGCQKILSPARHPTFLFWVLMQRTFSPCPYILRQEKPSQLKSQPQPISKHQTATPVSLSLSLSIRTSSGVCPRHLSQTNPSGQLLTPQQNWKWTQMPKLRHRCSQSKRVTKTSGCTAASEVLAASGNRGGAIGPSGGGGHVPVERKEWRRMVPDG